MFHVPLIREVAGDFLCVLFTVFSAFVPSAKVRFINALNNNNNNNNKSKK